MRASVLGVWKRNHDVIAGIDPWDVVDEAWSSMAHNNFQCKGPFLPFALRVAKNKAIDALRRAEVKRGDRSMDAPLDSADQDEDVATLHDLVAGSEGADVDYFREIDEVAVAQKLAFAEDAIYGFLTDIESKVFLAVRVDGKSGAAVGRELVPTLTGQRVGQIVAEAFIRIQAYIRAREQTSDDATDSEDTKGDEADGQE